jgi:hypothetical protein
MALSARLVLFAFCLCRFIVARDCNITRVVRVRLIDDQQLNVKMLEEAQEEANWVLRSLCVELVWTSEPHLKTVEIRILAMPLTSDVPEQSLGLSLVGASHGLRGAVFLQRVRDTHRRFASNVSLARLLGCVLAHEIGHLLLASGAHSSNGIMKAEIGREEALKASQRRLLFTPSDRQRFVARHNVITGVEVTERR